MRIINTISIPEAFFKSLEGKGELIRDPSCIAQYEHNTLSAKAHVGAVYHPGSKEDIQHLVRLANQFRVALYPISTGRNWGLGSAIPTRKNSVIVDLSRMNKIVDFNKDTGIITLQPGVTQGSLRAFLDSQNAPFMSSITGAGPHTSIVGNILDKGVGILGSAIHTIRSIECVLPDGSLYYDGVNTLCERQPDPPIRIGPGPLLDGLFIQCDFAIITAITLTLFHQPRYVSTFYISAPDDEALAKTVDIYHQYNTLNGQGSLLSGRWSKALMNLKKAPGYSYSCVIASMDSSIHRVRKKILKKLIREAGLKSHSISGKNIERLQKWFGYPLIKTHLSQLAPLVELLGISLNYSKGYSDEHNLKEQYQLLQLAIPDDKPLELARDGVGFIWFIVLFAATKDNLLRFRQIVSVSGQLHQVEDTRFHVLPYKSDLLVGLARAVYDLSDAPARDKAHAFYRELLQEGLKNGFVPHRAPIPVIHSLVDLDNPYWSVIKKIKHALDPNHIIAPDKYWPSDSE